MSELSQRNIDLVIPLSNGSHWQDNEIRYCLRSFDKHFFNLRNVYIVGYKPEFLKNVIHISVDDSFLQNKDANLINKILIACKREELSEVFIRCSDDQLLLQAVTLEDFQPKYLYNLTECDFIKLNRWKKRMKATFEYLEQNNYTTFNYDSHVPISVIKKEFVKIMKSIKIEDGIGKGYCINTLYCNVLDIERNVIKHKVTLEGNKEIDILEDDLFMGYNDIGLTDELKLLLQQRFFEKSRFEL